MPQLLVVHHTPSPAMQAVLEAVKEGVALVEEVELVLRPALSAGAADLLAADGVLLGTPANIGYMSGALKHFFDTVYYGDEFALHGVKEDRAGGDDAVRPRLPESDAPPGPEAAAAADLHRLLIGVRRRHPWLVDATVEEPDLLSNAVLAIRLS